MSNGKFVHLHTHSHYSLLDSAATLDALLDAARRAEMKALAMTDHGNMFGAVEFYNKARKSGIKPLVGYEAYVAPESRFSRRARGISEATYHLVLLAKNLAGYKSLCHLASAAYLEGFYYRPRIDKEILSAHKDGLVCLSGCLSGELAHYLLQDDYKSALDVAAFYKDLFGPEHFYVEIQDHALPEQRRILPGLVKIAAELDLPLVATNDIHYVHRDDWEAHDALLCINTGKLVSDENRMRFASREFYFKTEDEMRALFPDHPDAIDNSARIAEMCDLEIPFDQLHFPKFDCPGGKAPEEYLRELCEVGFGKRYSKDDAAARQRLERELEVICRVGYASYFLVVSDFVKFAKDNDIPVGPGRGSGAGSLVSYCLGITKIDPIKYDLLFERFLEENRREKADFDIDFCMEKRDRVIEYVRHKYGEDRVAQIITFGTMAAKGVVRDVGRVFAVPLAEVNRLCSLIPTALGTTLKSAFKAEPQLAASCEADARVARLFEIARRLEGLARHPSVHAAGVVIADAPLEEYVPLYSSDGQRITQYPMDILPEVGLLKMDFLGLRTLTIIRRAVELIKADHGVELDIDAIPLDDRKTFEMLSQGESVGVFQCESSGFRDLLKRLLPDKFSDLIALVALYRPGPLGGGMVDDFIQRKHGRAKIEYLHPLLESILDDTYGVMAYQEQVMKILNEMGGMSMADALTCIKAISKKKTDVIEARREAFLKGARESGVSARVASEIFDLIAYFGGYGFNKSHSTAYAMISYQTAYLKTNWPSEFLAATMTFEMGDTDKLVEFKKEVERLGITLLPPDVNESFADFRPVKTDDGQWAIRYALSALKGVGAKAVEALVEGREKAERFTSIFHLAENIDVHQVTKATLEIMTKAGALDGLGGGRAQTVAVIPSAVDAGGAAQADRKAGQATFFGAIEGLDEKEEVRLPDVPEWSEFELASREREAFGFDFEEHPLTAVIRTYATATATDLRVFADGHEVIIGGSIAGAKPLVTKNGRNAGEQMARFTVETSTGSVGAVIFPGDYKAFRELVANGKIVLVRGKIDRSGETPGIKASEIIAATEADEKLAKRMYVDLPGAVLSEELLARIVGICRKHPGGVPVYLRLTSPEASVVIKAGFDYAVKPSRALKEECETCLGEGCVSFLGENGSRGARQAFGA